jgi:hypothetical protein
MIVNGTKDPMDRWRFSSKRQPKDGITTNIQTIVSQSCPFIRRVSELRNLRKEKPMCPLCITTLALAAAGASASGGLATFVVRKPRPKNGSKKHEPKETDNPL